MKMIELWRDHVDIEHDGELYRLGGELGTGFIAWRSWTDRLISKDRTAPLTEEEKDQVMRNVMKYWNNDRLLISFVDDEHNLLCATKVVIAEFGKRNVDFMYKGKIVRVWGKKRFHCFRLKASTMEWVDPNFVHGLNEEERRKFIEEVLKFPPRYIYYEEHPNPRIAFVDKKGKKIKMAALK